MLMCLIMTSVTSSRLRATMQLKPQYWLHLILHPNGAPVQTAKPPARSPRSSPSFALSIFILRSAKRPGARLSLARLTSLLLQQVVCREEPILDGRSPSHRSLETLETGSEGRVNPSVSDHGRGGVIVANGTIVL